MPKPINRRPNRPAVGAGPVALRDQRVRAELRDGRPEWYRIANAVEDPAEAETTAAEVYIYDAIGGWWGVTAADFVRDLVALDVDELRVHINSPGGDVFDGIAILNALRHHRARVVVTIDGLAASAASFVAMAGDEVIMGRNAELMIHDAWGLAIGDARDMAKMAEDLDRVSNNIASIYADRAGGSVEDWREAMLAETWYSDAEAVEAGLADRVATKDDTAGDTDEAVVPSSDDDEDLDAWDASVLEVFAHAGRANAPAPLMPGRRASARTGRPKTPAASATGGTSPERSRAVAFSPEQLDTMRQQLGLAADADESTIVAAMTEALNEAADPTPAPPALPDGVTVIDSATLETLQAAARRGDAAAARQEREDREALVNAAVTDGRIAPARKDAWLNSLAADPGAADTLAKLERGLIPVDERGYTGGAADDTAPTTVNDVRESDVYKSWSF